MKFKHYKYIQYIFFITIIFSYLLHVYMFSTGIFSSVLNYMYICKSTTWNGHENLIGMSMKLLQAIARSNAKVSIYVIHIPMYR